MVLLSMMSLTTVRRYIISRLKDGSNGCIRCRSIDRSYGLGIHSSMERLWLREEILD